MKISRPNLLVLSIAAGYLLPLVIPGVGLDYQYFFIMVIVLFAWFLFKWDAVKALSTRSGRTEMILGVLVMGAVYLSNVIRGSSVGILDLLVIFLGAVVFTYGVKSFRLFWVPAAYGVVLLLGYQIEIYTPNYVVLQNWLAGVLASAVKSMGIPATVTGQNVTMRLSNGMLVQLDVSGECTGLQGILAFGLLSTMALLDVKPKISRLVPLLAIGFAGAFLVNIVRLLVVFLTFEFLGVDAGNTMHVYFGYLIFIAWVMVFWALAFRYLAPGRSSLPPDLDTHVQLGQPAR
ncbi:MAG: archaeosortase/exosortase family protein [Nitrososphaerales archaeon]